MHWESKGKDNETYSKLFYKEFYRTFLSVKKIWQDSCRHISTRDCETESKL